MDLIEEALCNLVFTQNTPWDFSRITISSDALAVLVEIDGEKSLGLISGILGRPLEDIQNTINYLGRLKLIRQKDSSLITQYEVSPPDENAISGFSSPFADDSRRKGKDTKRLYRGVSYRG